MTDHLLKVFKVMALNCRDMPSKTVGYYSSENKAKIASHRKSWYGQDGRIEERAAIQNSDGTVYVLEVADPVVVDGNFEELQAEVALEAERKRLELRESALSKLTRPELEALGVKL